MSRFRRQGWPILLPQGWQDMSRAERRAWWDDVWSRRVKPEFLVPPKGRPDALRWAGALVCPLLVVRCSGCRDTVIARVDLHENRVVITAGEQHKSTFYGLRCPTHGRVHVPYGYLQERMKQARDSGRVRHVKLAPRS